MEKTNKMSTKKVIAILAAIFLICGGALALLVIARNYTKTVASEEKYEYFNPDETKAKPDDGFVIDGVLDEEQYKECNWLKLQNDQGGAGVDLAMTSFYGDEGMYIVYDVTESSPIYVNLERESYMNSGIEMYLALSDVTSMASNKVFEIDLLPTGDMNFRQRTGKDNWVNVASTDEIMAYLGATTKGGPVNTEECSGYNLELFIPWAYMDKLGMNASEMKQNFVYINPVHITSYNLTGTESGTDRYWYSFATQLGSDGWNDVAQYFRFAKRGVLGTVPIKLVEGANYKISGNDSVIPGMMTTIQITPEKGYALNSILVNGEEYIKKVSYNKDGSVTLKVRGVKEGLTISASVEPVTEGNKTLSGIVQVHKLGGDTLEGVTVSYKGPGGEKPIEFDSNGRFELKDLKQGYYTITAEKKGYAPINRGIYLNRDIETELTLEYQMFEAETGYNWILDNQNDGVLNRFGGSGKILSVDSYKKFTVEANFKYDTELAAMSDGDTFLQQRSGIQIKFSNGKYWRVDLMKEKDVFKVQYAKHNEATVFNWKTVHELTKEEIAKYQSEDGIKLSILRDGNYAWVCLNGKPVAIEVLDDEYKNCTAQIGFEGWVANQEIEEMNYNISTSFKQNLKNFYFTTSGKWDISRQLEGVVSLPGGGTHVLPFYKEYTDIDLTLKNVKEHDKTGKKPGRTDVLFEFDTNGDGKVDKSVSFGILCTDPATKTCWVQTLGNADNYLAAKRIKGLYKLSPQEVEKYLNGDGVEFRVVRKGTEVYLFVEGEEVAIFDLTQNNSGVKANTKAKVSLRHYDAEGDVVLPFTVTDKVEKVEINKIFKDNEKWDLTKQYEGVVSLPGGGTDTSLQFFKKYQNIDLTITAKENDKTGKKPGRTDVLFEFDLNNDGTMDKNVSFGVVQLSNGSCEIQTLGWNEKFIPEKRINALYQLDYGETLKYKNEGIGLRVVRYGADVFLYVDGKQVAVFDLTQNNSGVKADSKATVILRHYDAVADNVVIPFKVTDQVTKPQVAKPAKKLFKDNYKWDLSKQLEGVVTLPGGGTQAVEFYDKYTDIDLTLQNVKEHDSTGKKPGRTDVLFEFDINGDNKIDKTVSFGITCTEPETGTCWVQTLGNADNFLPSTRIKGLYKLNAQEAEEYLNGDGVDFRVVRKGTDVYLFVDGEEVAIFDLTQNNSGVKADTKAEVSLRHYDAEGDVVLPFTVTDKVEKVEIDKIFKDNEKWDLTKQYEGVVSLPGGGTDTSLQLFKKYQNIDLTITAKENDTTGKKPGRTDVLFEFDLNNDGTTDKNVSFGVVQLSNGNCEIQTLGWDKNFIPEKRINALYQLDYGETLKYKNEGIELRVVRYGADVFLYVDGKQVAVFDLTQNNSGVKEDSKATVILRHYDAVADNVVIPFKVTDQVEKPEVVTPVNKIFKDNNKWILTKQLDGEVTLPGGGTQTLEFYKKYTDFDLTLKNVKEYGNTTTPGRTDVLFEFDTNNDGTYDKSVSFGATYNKTQKRYKVETLGISSNYIPEKRQTELYRLDDAEIAKYLNEGIELRVIRYGAFVSIYVEGDCVANFDLTQNNSGVTANMAARVSLRHYDAKTDEAVFPFEVSDKVERIFKDNSKWNLEKQFGGVVSLPGGGTDTSLQFAKKYKNFDLTIMAKEHAAAGKAAGRTDVLLEFNVNVSGGIWKNTSFGILKRNDGVYVETLGWAQNHIPAKRANQLYKLSDEEAQKYLTDGIELRILRYGKDVYIYVDGKAVATFDLSQNNSGVTADMEAMVGLRHYDAVADNVEIPFTITETIEKIFKDNSKWDLTKQFAGEVTLPAGGTDTSLQFAKKYTKMDVSVIAKENDTSGNKPGRTDILFEFNVNVSGGIWKNTSFGILKRNDGIYVETLGWAQNHIPATRANKLYKLNDAEAAKYMNEGVELRVVRYGTDAFIYVEGKYITTFDLSQNNSGVTADMEAMVTLRHYDAVANNIVIPFAVSDEVDLEELRLYGKKAEVKDYAYSFAVIPDTQIVAENDVKNGESNFAKIYDWILANKTSKNIQYVFGLGDITDNNNIAEWTLAKSQISKLDGVIPYSVIRGNHDLLGYFSAEDKTADYMTQYLGTDVYKGQFADGGFYSNENIWNSWRTFKVGNVNYLMLALDYGPSDDVLSWASNVIAAHPAHNVIITTHAYLFRDGTTLDSKDVCPPVGSGGSNNGDHIWEKLISKHENIVLVMSGHDPSENIIVSKDKGVNGNTVTSMLIDAQDVEKEEGSLGMVAMLYFSEDGKNIEVEYYSTTEEKFFTTESQFKTTLDVVEDVDVYGTGYVPVKSQQVKTTSSYADIPRTIEVTFNRANLTNRSIILGSCDGKTTDYINLEAPKNEGIIYFNATLGGVSYQHSFNKVSIPTNEIVRVTVVIEDTAIKCYVNGVLAQTRDKSNGGNGSKTVTAMLASAEKAKLPVGYGFGDDLRNTDDHYFIGTIYDIALWSDVRTASEIATSSIGNVNTDNYKDNLIAAYDFRAGYNSTDGQNPFHKDLAANGYNLSGTLNVGTSYIPLSGLHATTPVTKGTNFTTTTNKKTLTKNAYTVSAWVYLPSDYTSRGGGIFSNYKNGNTSCASFEIYTNGMPRFYHINGNKEVVNLSFSKVTICADKWVHLTFVVSGKTVSCYKDGVLAQTLYSDKIDLQSVNPEYVIGGDLRDGNGQYFKGRMLQIELFENALSAKEVKRLYNAGADKTGKNVLAIYEYLITE